MKNKSISQSKRNQLVTTQTKNNIMKGGDIK